MKSRARTARKALPSAVLLTLVWLGLSPWQVMADEASANPTTMDFAADGTIRMKLSTGAMEVVGVPDARIRVSWHARSPDDEREVSVKLQRSGEKDATLVVDGPGNHMQYRIEVPRQSDVTIDMGAGDLEVHGILGSLNAELLAGNMELRVAEPQHYGRVSAAVTAGGLSASPWRIDKGGLWRSFKASGDGEYDLRARLGAGQLTISSEP